MSRHATPPALPTDTARLHVAMWKIANALGVVLDPSRTDHELLEQVADMVSPRLARAFREGYDLGNFTPGSEPSNPINPYDGTPL